MDLLEHFHAQDPDDERKLSQEKELVLRMQKGDDSAFEILYEKYFDRIYAYVIRFVRHREIAEDIVSNTFLKAFSGRTAFVWKNISFGAWLYKIASNAVIDHFREKKSVSLADEMQNFAREPKTHEELDMEFLGKKLKSALTKLPEKYRTVLMLKYFNEMPHQEIASILGTSANNVGVLVHRALNKCKKYV
ncbi:MAG: hypothetical protein ACD_76C00027G0003 [uncultured bacterium]|nr:MAG: hypothetical protein ACD_76C00027G0003 [uncultured bacterium]HBD05229.1 hypothetical protein [Candidatus Uhrbacteria bacterium]